MRSLTGYALLVDGGVVVTSPDRRWIQGFAAGLRCAGLVPALVPTWKIINQDRPVVRLVPRGDPVRVPVQFAEPEAS